ICSMSLNVFLNTRSRLPSRWGCSQSWRNSLKRPSIGNRAKFIEPMLSEATSGLKVAAGSKRSSTVMPGAPPVVRFTTQPERCLMRGRKRAKASGVWSGLPVSGLRACRWTMAAPASAAPTAASAISSGVTGRCGDMEGVWIAPVTAQVIMTLSPNDIRLFLFLLTNFFGGGGFVPRQRHQPPVAPGLAFHQLLFRQQLAAIGFDNVQHRTIPGGPPLHGSLQPDIDL